jgi:hypothetical protein
MDLLNLPGMQRLQADEARRGLNQIGIDNKMKAPWYGLGEAANLAATGGFGTSSGTQTAPNPNYVDPFTQVLQTALGAGSMVAGMGGAGGFGLWGPKMMQARG